MELWPNLEFPLFDKAIVNREKKLARYHLIQNLWRSLKIKSELPPLMQLFLALKLLIFPFLFVDSFDINAVNYSLCS